MSTSVNPFGVASVGFETATHHADFRFNHRHVQVAGDFRITQIGRPGFNFCKRKRVAKSVEAIAELTSHVRA